MLYIRLLEEGGQTGPDVSGLVWVVLLIFVVMVFLGWLASSKGWLKKDEEPVQSHGHDEHGH